MADSLAGADSLSAKADSNVAAPDTVGATAADADLPAPEKLHLPAELIGADDQAIPFDVIDAVVREDAPADLADPPPAGQVATVDQEPFEESLRQIKRHGVPRSGL